MNQSTNAVVITSEWLRNTIIYNAISSVFAGIFSGFLMSLVVWWIKRRIEKADAFTEIILPILRGIEEAKNSDEIIDSYKASRPVVRDAAAKFSNYIFRKRKRAIFNAAWRQYCGIEKDGFELNYGTFNYPEDLPKILFPPGELVAKNEIFRLLNELLRLSQIHTSTK